MIRYNFKAKFRAVDGSGVTGSTDGEISVPEGSTATQIWEAVATLIREKLCGAQTTHVSARKAKQNK